MNRLASALLIAGWIALPWKPHLPAWAERWLYNPRERTERVLEARREKDTEAATQAADTAHRLAPDDPRTGFNAGTEQLEAGRSRDAAKLLEPAAKALDKEAPELAPAAWYNLGGAQLKAGDAAAAVKAYRQALLRNPDDADAKWNLELALKDLDKQRMGGKGGRRGSLGNRPGEREQSQKPGEGNPSNRRDKNPQDPGQGSQGGQQQSQGQQGQQNQPSPHGGGRQPQFNNQPEMSAREAASLLSAVENLERRQRRSQAAQRSKQQAAKGKDW
jgi:tetratricopeptide (TPR) repeat protein